MVPIPTVGLVLTSEGGSAGSPRPALASFARQGVGVSSPELGPAGRT